MEEESSRATARQPWLIPYENPLKKRHEPEFFKRIPKSPGVYLMIDEDGDVLYVGKAKNLRERISSYKRARPDNVSRKVIRMLILVREIRWEECASEKDALLLENRLLRELDPPFNVLNTRPDTYYFIGIRKIGAQVRFRLTQRRKRQADILYGAYKGRRMVRDGYGALLRLFWVAQSSLDRFAYPAKLTRYKLPPLYAVACPPEWFPPLRHFFRGTSDELLSLLTEHLLKNEKIPKFVYHVIQEDLEIAREFFLRGPRRNRELRRNHGVRKQVIEQEQIDDLLVLEQARLGKVDSGLATQPELRQISAHSPKDTQRIPKG